MDARSLFAVLAIVLLLWLLTWVKWDSQAKTARESRRRLRSRLVDSTLADKVKASNATPTSPITRLEELNALDVVDEYALPSVNVNDDSYLNAGVNARSRPEDSRVLEMITLLEQQLQSAEESAVTARQNDLELRRLRGELHSIEAERSAANHRIQSLENSINDQQTALVYTGQDDTLNANMGKLQLELTEREKQNNILLKRLHNMISAVDKASVRTGLELARADSDTSYTDRDAYTVDIVLTDEMPVQAAHSSAAEVEQKPF